MFSEETTFLENPFTNDPPENHEDTGPGSLSHLLRRSKKKEDKDLLVNDSLNQPSVCGEVPEQPSSRRKITVDFFDDDAEIVKAFIEKARTAGSDYSSSSDIATVLYQFMQQKGKRGKSSLRY